jgi:formylglycine-generating enzyme required for sulfatase activity
MAQSLIDKNGAEMIYIPAGEFWMGSPEGEGGDNEHPRHKVYLDAYYIHKHVVTFEQYDKFCEATNRIKPSDYGWGRGNRPVIDVSWEDAKSYAEWVGCRLPTEAEWEKACRAGSEKKYSFGDDPSALGEYAWFLDNSGNRSHPVGEKKPNAWGIYDMHGNVWEWCADWYDRDYYVTSPRNNPTGPSSGRLRVLRGGAWNDYLPNDLRSALRYMDRPTERGFDRYGFRCVRSAK